MPTPRLALIAALLFPVPAVAQHREVTFAASDGQQVFGTWYSAGRPPKAIIIAAHQAGASGDAEYNEIAFKLAVQGYDVLAIDQRSGGDRFGGVNRTVAARGISGGYCEAEADITGALRFVRDRSAGIPIVLWGSSYSAALVIRVAATDRERVAGVLAFSPASGTPMDGCRAEESAQQLSVPLMVLRPQSEIAIESVAEQAELFRAAGHTVVVADPGVHGSSMLVAERVPGGMVDGTWERVLGWLGGVVP